MLNSAQAQKKYTTVGYGGCDEYESVEVKIQHRINIVSYVYC